MKTIIAGSRDITDITLLKRAIKKSGFNITEVVCGGARGADELGRKWGIINMIPVKKFPAKWDEFGKSAGYRRNVEMAEYAGALIALWDGTSKGTKHMIDIAVKKNLKVYVYNLSDQRRKFDLNCADCSCENIFQPCEACENYKRVKKLN